MKIGIIGAKGFVGSSLQDELMDDHFIKGITRENYVETIDACYKFDVLINANGNSRKHTANNNSVWDFEESVLSVYRSVFDFKYKKYIFISSIDAEVPGTPYGFNKHLSENIVKQYCKDYSIIRCPSIIGKNAVKGVVKGIQDGSKVYLTPDSRLMLINVSDVAETLNTLLKTGGPSWVERFYPTTTITIEQIGKILKKPVNFANELRGEYYDLYGSDRLYKSSEQYLKYIL